MKKIDKDELFEHLRGFLKAKGVELHEGSYTQQIHHGCRILADTVNLSQQALRGAKSTVARNLDKVRQVIHEKTAPKGPAAPPKPAQPSQPKTAEPKAGAKRAAAKPKKATAGRKSRT